MSLSKRDTFVRYMDPKKTIWEDANGDMHYSIENMLKAFDLPDTPETRERVAEIIRESFNALPEDHRPKKIVERLIPDHPDYYKQ